MVFAINANKQDSIRSLSGGYIGYNEIGRNLLLRHILGAGNPGNITSTGNNFTTFGTIHSTIRGVGFSGYVASYPNFPNGATTIGETWVGGTTGISTNSTTTLTTQTIDVKYLINRIWDMSGIEFIRYPLRVQYIIPAGGITCNFTSINYSVSVKKVTKAGVVSTLGSSVTGTFTNKSTSAAGTYTDTINLDISNITGINAGDIVYFHTTVTASLQSGHSSMNISMGINHTTDIWSELTMVV